MRLPLSLFTHARCLGLRSAGAGVWPLALLLALPITSAASALPTGTASDEKPTQRVERIHHQDKSVAIDELRVGGQTQSIEVKPSNEKLRPYQVQPEKGDAGIADKNSNKGLTNRSWKLFDF